MINATILGRLGKDAKVMKSKEGNMFLSFTMATNSRTTNSNSEIEEKTMWISCIYASKNAEKLAEYLKKGKQVVVSGRLIADTFTSNKNDKTMTGVDLKLSVRSLEFAGSKEESKAMPEAEEMPAVKEEEFSENEAPF